MTATTVDNPLAGRDLGTTGETLAAHRAHSRDPRARAPGSTRPTGNAGTVLGVGS
jgi:hypothetical protein